MDDEPDTTEECRECGAAEGEPCKDSCWIRDETKRGQQ